MYPTDKNWKLLEPAVIPPNAIETLVADVARQNNITEDQARKLLDDYEDGSTYWLNNIYQVQMRTFADGKMVHLNIRRRDGKAILRDWRHFQWIKNQLVGSECEAVELYPAESRMVDSNNKYHLWCSTDPTFRFPIGMTERDVDYTNRGATAGTRQRPLNQ